MKSGEIKRDFYNICLSKREELAKIFVFIELQLKISHRKVKEKAYDFSFTFTSLIFIKN